MQVDRWTRPEGGGGITCVLQACISISHNNLLGRSTDQCKADLWYDMVGLCCLKISTDVPVVNLLKVFKTINYLRCLSSYCLEIYSMTLELDLHKLVILVHILKRLCQGKLRF